MYVSDQPSCVLAEYSFRSRSLAKMASSSGPGPGSASASSPYLPGEIPSLRGDGRIDMVANRIPFHVWGDRCVRPAQSRCGGGRIELGTLPAGSRSGDGNGGSWGIFFLIILLIFLVAILVLVHVSAPWRGGVSALLHGEGRRP